MAEIIDILTRSRKNPYKDRHISDLLEDMICFQNSWTERNGHDSLSVIEDGIALYEAIAEKCETIATSKTATAMILWLNQCKKNLRNKRVPL